MVDRLLTPAEAAERLALSEATVKDYLRAGKLVGVKTGNRWKVRESDLEEFIKNLSAD